MEARAKLLGHPVHQMLIVLPLGLLAGVVIFDVVGLLFDGESWSVVAYWLIPAGVVSGLIAALFGLLDWTGIPAGTRARRVGLLHAGTNVVVLVLFALSWWWRGGPMEEPGLIALLLSFTGGGLSLLGGWLGGELVGRLGVGVSEHAHVDAPSSLSDRPATDRA